MLTERVNRRNDAWRRILRVLGLAAALLFLGPGAHANMVQPPPLTVSVSNVPPTVECDVPAGTVTGNVTSAGGNGHPVSLSVQSNDPTDIGLSSTTPPANVITLHDGFQGSGFICSSLPQTCTATSTSTCPVINASVTAQQQ